MGVGEGAGISWEAARYPTGSGCRRPPKENEVQIGLLHARSRNSHILPHSFQEFGNGGLFARRHARSQALKLC